MVRSLVRPVLFTRSTLLLIGVIACFVVTAHGGEPFRFANTPGRLPKTVVPHAYRIHIEPSLKDETVKGEETVDLEVREVTTQFVLNSEGLQIMRAVVRPASGGAETELRCEASDALQLLTLTAPQELPAGAYQLEISWQAGLHEQPQGLFITRYTTEHGEKRALATQMEATDARRMFPCWDEPVFRATFELTAVVPQAHMALSNMPIASETALADGRKEVHFSPTPLMACYLVGFAAGEFEALEDEFEGVKLRIITTEGKKEQGRDALEATKQILGFYNDYFGQRYPMPKLDQFCFPAFPMGGMENWGAIFYNDTTLLADPATASQANRERVFAVVAHEIAHQWFGDLVTMAWWDNLWLNEGFASWMGTKATNHFHPEWHVWERAAGGKERAMSRDARRTTHPIQQPVATEAQANDAFDEITYQKGQAFLRMLEMYLGEDHFRAGIREYISKHAYSSATTADLWAALKSGSGKEVSEIAANWTEQPGFPLVHVTSVCLDGKQQVTLSQERFTIHQKVPAPLSWKTPVSVGPVSAPGDAQTILLGATPEVMGGGACDNLLKGNLLGAGYFRVKYDDQTYSHLTRLAPSLPDAERLNLLADTWALVQAERLPATSLLELLTRLAPGETVYAVWSEILEILGSIDALERGEPTRAAFRGWASQLLRGPADRLGWEARSGEPDLDKSLRSSVLQALGELGDPKVNEEAAQRFAAFVQDPKSLSGDLRKTVLDLTGRSASAETYAQLHELAKREVAAELKSKLYHAMASSLDPKLAEKTLALALSDELPPNEAAGLVSRVGRDGEHREKAWAFGVAHQAELSAKLPVFRLNEYFPDLAHNFTNDAAAEELEQFAQQHLPAGATHAVEKAADDIRFKAALKARLLPAVQAWISR